MKRHALLKHLKQHGCVLLREGEKHSIFTTTGLVDRGTSAVPRHVEIANLLAREIAGTSVSNHRRRQDRFERIL